MKIGIDAKRIFLNKTGLGTYGRNLLKGLNSFENENQYYLYTTKKSDIFSEKDLNQQFTTRESKAFSKNYWRTVSISKDLEKDGIELYHGTSNELPISLGNCNIKTVVDIHDLLFLRFPKFYSFFDRQIFRLKTEFACKNADIIVATSQATKYDIVKFYGTNPEKIKVVYQSCDPSFYIERSVEETQLVTEKYKLPKEYILCVGTIQERKNQKQILEALKICKTKIPLVLVGGGKEYKKELVQFAKENQLDLYIPEIFVRNEDLPAIYQMASIFVFPGLYEGFGIPVLEAMASKTQVITSINTSMGEIATNTLNLINPLSPEDIAERIESFLNNKNESLIEENFQRALEFSNKNFAKSILSIYKKLLS